MKSATRFLSGFLEGVLLGCVGSLLVGLLAHGNWIAAAVLLISTLILWYVW